MRQRWADLLFLHWALPPEPLQALLPPGLEIDTFEGHAYVGLVPFTMTGVRPTLLPSVPPLSNFHETNVRTYVHHRGREPGVWFFSLDAANPIAARLGRAWFKLPYFYARMSLQHERRLSGFQTPDGVCVDYVVDSISYSAERRWPEPTPAGCRVYYTPSGPVTPAEVGSLEHFLVERYILYAYKNGTLYRGRVHHVPYPLRRAEVHTLEENLIAAAGIARPDTPPLAHYADELRVRIYPLERT